MVWLKTNTAKPKSTILIQKFYKLLIDQIAADQKNTAKMIILKNSFLPVNSYEYDELTKIFPRFNFYSPLSRSKTPTYPCNIFYF